MCGQRRDIRDKKLTNIVNNMLRHCFYFLFFFFLYLLKRNRNTLFLKIFSRLIERLSLSLSRSLVLFRRTNEIEKRKECESRGKLRFIENKKATRKSSETESVSVNCTPFQIKLLIESKIYVHIRSYITRQHLISR